ncbi:MAG: TlpA disulfide reductase family protein [Bacteroidota bacterium]
MKIINLLILIIFFVIPITCFSQAGKPGKPFTIHGQIADSKLDSVSVVYVNEQGKVERQVIASNKGAFSISGSIAQPTMAYILFIHKGEKLNRNEVEVKTNKVYIEPTDMTINDEADVDGYIKVKGSKAQDEWNDLKRKTTAAQLSNGSTRSALNPTDKGTAVALRFQLAQVNYDYFLKHPGSYIAANQAMYFTAVFSLDSIKKLYNNYSAEIKESIDGKRLAGEIKSRTVGLPGTLAYQFSVKDKEGKDLSLTDFKGKYVLLDFWANWCVPCRASMPHMIGLYQKYKDKNFDVIAVADNDSRVKEWLEAIDHDGTGMFHHILTGVSSELRRKGIANPRDLDENYGIHALPTLILVDPSGKIIGRFAEDKEQLDKMLADIFK